MAERNNYPKLHNAAWPGVVGKGTAGAEPIIPLDTLLELTAKAEADGQKFDGIDLWLADPHISIDSDDDQIKRVAEHIASYGLKVGSFVAPIWPAAGGGSAIGPPDERKRFVSQVGKQQGSESGCANSACDPRAAFASTLRPASLSGTRSQGQHQAYRRRRSAKRPRPRRTMANFSSPKARSAGAACSRGARTSICSKRSACPGRRLPGGHGAFDALHSRLQRREDRLLPEDTTGKTARFSTPPTRRWRDALRPWTYRFPCGAERRHRLRLGRSRQDRPPRAGRPIPTASSMSPSTPATGCATTPATRQRDAPCLLGRLHVPQFGDDSAADLERHSGRDGEGARRAWLARIIRDRGDAQMSQEKTQYRPCRVPASWAAPIRNAFRQAGHFFKLDYEPMLKAVATRNAAGAADFRRQLGLRKQSRATGAS